jgi:hypothetical protein
MMSGSHHHHHDHDHDHSHAPHALRGHNGHSSPVQWQTPHLPEQAPPRDDEHQDLDLLETSFIESFQACSDPISFLRLAHIPFEVKRDERTLSLLRVQIEDVRDVGSLAPMLGGGFRYDRLAGRLHSRRHILSFIYYNGEGLTSLSLREVKSLA